MKPSLSHLRFDLAVPFFAAGVRAGDSSLEDVGPEAEFASLRARREPLGPGVDLAVKRWFTAGDEGRDVSGVGIGVAVLEFELASL